MHTLTKKLSDTLEVFQDLSNLYMYQEGSSPTLTTMYNHTIEVLNNVEIDISTLFDEKGNNLLHLSSQAYHIDFFIKVAAKGINPYLKNHQNHNAFQSKYYDFAHTLWLKFEHIYFEDTVVEKSFSHITKGFHKTFKQSIYEHNIKNNSSQYNIKEICHFLQDNDIYSHNNVLMFYIDKYNGTLLELMHFIDKNKHEFTPQDNSLALHCGLKIMSFTQNQSDTLSLFEHFISQSHFDIDQHFLQSMKYCGENYKKSVFEHIFHQQTMILIDKNYDIEQPFNFYFSPLNTKDNTHNSITKLSHLYEFLSLKPVWDYYSYDKKLSSLSNKDNCIVTKKNKI